MLFRSQAASLNLVHGPSTPGVQCGVWHLLRTYPPTNVVVGATFSRVSYENTNFFYSAGQSSSIGIGVGNGNGTFHASGTHSVSTDKGQSWGPARAGAVSIRYRTKFTFGRYAVQCSTNRVQVIKWDGGATVQRTTAPRATWCLFYKAGSKFYDKTTNAFTFTGGADISAQIGIDLSAHTGYSTTAELYYNQVHAHYLCGTNDYVGGTPKRIVAGLPA